ncbi:MAG TPA: DUF1080 domain-containing protein [Planctomycetaceae bacterium]|nr:DUF1080 domain-containing protein [Planctomycetaceae bacterium]
MKSTKPPTSSVEGPMSGRWCGFSRAAAALVLGLLAAQAVADDKPATPAETAQASNSKDDGQKWISLFDGKTLDGWKVSKFGGEGPVTVEDGRILLGFGSDLTGIHTDRKLPKINYEVDVEAMRVDGSDFFCGLTFPVKDDPCSLIIGGWGGGVCGLSSLDRLDASENETTTYREFKKGQWYKVRLRVMENRIQAWLDDKEIVDVDTTGRRLSIRYEVEPSRPFGFASWQTTAALRNIRIRELSEEELKAAAKMQE